MFDIGGFEILILLVVALVILKPEDFPQAMYKAGKFFRKIRQITREFYNLFDSFSSYDDEKSIKTDDKVNNHKDIVE